MKILWSWFLHPVIHFLVVLAVLQGAAWFFERLKIYLERVATSRENLATLANTGAKSAQIEAVVTRADGTVEIHGVIAYTHRNPLKRWAWAFRQAFCKGA